MAGVEKFQQFMQSLIRQNNNQLQRMMQQQMRQKQFFEELLRGQQGGAGIGGRTLHCKWRALRMLGLTMPFDGWSLQRRQCMRSADVPAVGTPMAAEDMPMWNGESSWALRVHFPEVNIDRAGVELYGLLDSATLGEELQGCPGSGSSGLEAWCRLVHRRAPRSLARVVRLMGLVTSPPKITEFSNVGGGPVGGVPEDLGQGGLLPVLWRGGHPQSVHDFAQRLWTLMPTPPTTPKRSMPSVCKSSAAHAEVGATCAMIARRRRGRAWRWAGVRAQSRRRMD